MNIPTMPMVNSGLLSIPVNETSRQKQARFTYMIALLIIQAGQMGFRLRFFDVSSSEAKLHIDKNGVALLSIAETLPLGLWWESLGGGAIWGAHLPSLDVTKFALAA